MSLQIRARGRAVIHLLRDWNWAKPDHQIWRVYSWFGFDTRRVFCTCGVEFTKRPQGSPSVADLLATVAKAKEGSHASR